MQAKGTHKGHPYGANLLVFVRSTRSVYEINRQKLELQTFLFIIIFYLFFENAGNPWISGATTCRCFRSNNFMLLLFNDFLPLILSPLQTHSICCPNKM